MLITFKTKSSPEVLMYHEHAERILGLLHKSPTRGVITAAEAASALALLEQEVAHSQQHPETEIELHPASAEPEDGETAEHARQQQVGFAARAYPLLQMLRTARDQQQDIVWGV